MLLSVELPIGTSKAVVRKATKNTTAEQGLKRTEVLWMNYEPVKQTSLII